MLTLEPKYIPLNDRDFVLDLGCGEGRHITGLLNMKENTYFIGLDLQKKNLLCVKKKLSQYFPQELHRILLLESSGFSLPFADNSIQHIICSEVLEHIVDYDNILREINRVLAPGGHLYVSVPRMWPEKICWWLSDEYHTVEGGHVRIFNARALAREICKLGFSAAHKKHWAHALHSPFWWLKCMLGTHNSNFFLLRWYHRVLVWDLLKKPLLTKACEKLLNPVLGKSVVLYFRKPETLSATLK